MNLESCSDYEQDLVPGFRIGNAGTGTYLSTSEGISIYLPLYQHPTSGEILNHAILPEHILLRTAAFSGKSGNPPQLRFAPGTSHYFIVSRPDSSLRGPYSAAEFESELSSIQPHPIYWELSRQNFLSGLLCTLVLLSPAIITIFCLLIAATLWFRQVRKKRRSWKNWP